MFCIARIKHQKLDFNEKQVSRRRITSMPRRSWPVSAWNKKKFQNCNCVRLPAREWSQKRIVDSRFDHRTCYQRSLKSHISKNCPNDCKQKDVRDMKKAITTALSSNLTGFICQKSQVGLLGLRCLVYTTKDKGSSYYFLSDDVATHVWNNYCTSSFGFETVEVELV